MKKHRYVKMKVVITPSTRKIKKYMAIFFDKNGKKIKTTHFGQRHSSDYTKHGDDRKKELYLNRHRKREKWENYRTAGSLARYILWNHKTLEKSIADYKERFNLQ